MTPEEMEKAIIKNLSTRTGNSLEEWIKILLEEKYGKVTVNIQDGTYKPIEEDVVEPEIAE